MEETNKGQKSETVKAATPAKVKIKALRPIMISMRKEGNDMVGTMVEPGQIVDVTEDEAKMFCDTKYEGHYSFGGNRNNDNSMHDYRRAQRVA